ncbi:hypothetical protein DMH26_29905 [Streptomyces sp. WAC 05379]|uniref:hypothetical protein n=1 Tax=Streptomyces sp. WAC 05379 TaxID=2203207 RepID=UPI000F73E838|nr:hypothetical protein [Streptomyces sp. WAC 05379]RSN89369.1 hypothetical protein DMH26_29905 [Streptomyces sp. WAC 05379]
MLVSLKTRIVGLITIDFGEVKSLGDIRTSLSASHRSISVSDVRRNSHHFDAEQAKPLLKIQHRDPMPLNSLLVDPLEIGHADPRRAHLELLRGAQFREHLVLSASGIGCLVFITEIQQRLDTDQIIFLTNALVRNRSTLALADGSTFDIPRRIEFFRRTLEPFVESTRTGYFRTYSMIHLIELAPDTVDAAVASGVSLYNRYENEFHALSVRVIEAWQQRFPHGSRFPEEPNCSLSPVGVLKMNMRNTVFYEHPYNEAEVEDLYYLAMVEIRIWDLLITAQLQLVQAQLAQYEHFEFEEISPELARRLHLNSLRTFNEFYGYYLSTSKRARHFYRQAYRTFDVADLLSLLRDKTSQLDAIVVRIRETSVGLYQRELVAHQRDLLEQSTESMHRDRAVTRVLNLISLVTGLSLALQLKESLALGDQWRLPLLGGACLAYVALYAAGRWSRGARNLRLREEIRVTGVTSAESLLDELLQRNVRRSVQNVGQSRQRVSWVVRQEWPNHQVVRFQMVFALAGTGTEREALLTAEASMSLWKWQKRRRAVERFQATLTQHMDAIGARPANQS